MPLRAFLPLGLRASTDTTRGAVACPTQQRVPNGLVDSGVVVGKRVDQIRAPGLNRPALVISHNKTLAAQLFAEFNAFFPENAVEYFVSYYDYYQPEAYVPVTDTYIEKDADVNDEIDRLRLRATASLLDKGDDVLLYAATQE